MTIKDWFARRKQRVCHYGHPVPKGKKMCEHRHYIG
jgi:hypothetical protein